MKKTMKKLIVLMMVLILVMPQTLIMAGETGDTTSRMSSAMTITEELTRFTGKTDRICYFCSECPERKACGCGQRSAAGL